MKYVKQDAPVVLPPSVAQMNAAATEKEQPSMLEVKKKKKKKAKCNA